LHATRTTIQSRRIACVTARSERKDDNRDSKVHDNRREASHQAQRNPFTIITPIARTSRKEGRAYLDYLRISS